MKTTGLERRHYELVADALKTTEPPKHWPSWSQWQADVLALADALKSNPTFKRAKFLKRVGLLPT